MITKLLFYTLIGAGAGGILGALLKCKGATCPITGRRWSAVFIGAGIGLLLALTSGTGDIVKTLSSLPHIATPQEYEQKVLGASRPVMVDFYSPTCGPCRRLAPTMAEMENLYRGRVDFYVVDVSTAGELSRMQQVEAVPTVALYSHGQLVHRWVGLDPADTYRQALDSVLQATSRPIMEIKESPMTERKGAITFKGGPLTLLGNEVAVGQKAPDCTLVANDLSEVKLSKYRGKIVILSSVPSLDTPVCSIETRKFNQEAAKLGDGVVVLTISMDLPFAQKRWCGAEGIDRVVTLSDYRGATFGEAYGVLIKELHLLARCIFVVDAEGVVRYKQLVQETTHEPNYQDVLDAVAKIQKG
jgi:thiol peroxidase